MVAVQAGSARSWAIELLQVALAAAGLWVALSALDIALYQRLNTGHSAGPGAPLACIVSAPLSERVRSGSLEEPASAPVASSVSRGRGELADALARVQSDLGGMAAGVRHEDVFYVDAATVAKFVGAALRPQAPGAPARMVTPSGIIELTPLSLFAARNFQQVKLPHPPREIGGQLHLPIRGIDSILPLEATWNAAKSVWTLTHEDREMRLAAPEDLFEIVVDRSDRTLDVSYAGRHLVRWACCTGEGNNSPIGDWRVRNKAVWPPWRAYWGEYIPGGSPRNPLGARWLGTTARGYETGRSIGIHGTNQPSSIGRRISGGCIRLTNAHAIEMYETIPIGSRVVIKE